jgi:hypothetical protein
MHAAKAPTALAATALLVAVLGSAPITHAAGKLILPKHSVGTGQLKRNAVTGAKVRNGTLSAIDFTPGQLPAGPKGDPGSPGPGGAKGDKGDAGIAVAYARVDVTPYGATVDGFRSKGVSEANVTRPDVGVTCFKGLGFTPKAAVVSADLGDPGSPQSVTSGVALAPAALLTTACGAGAQAAVATMTNDVSVDTGYYVIFE